MKEVDIGKEMEEVDIGKEMEDEQVKVEKENPERFGINIIEEKRRIRR